MSNTSATEATPLLDSEASGPGASSNPGVANRARAFRIATTASLVTGLLTLILLAVCMILFTGAPSNYNPPYEIYYTFAPIAGFASIACLHSGLVLLDGAPLSGTIAGMLIDIFAGLYFLFQSLYGMQQIIREGRDGYTGCRPPYKSPSDSLDECNKWRAGVMPVVWLYLFATLALGLAHVILLLLRAATYKRRGSRELRVMLVDEDGNAVRR